jgi:hypothetical protein
MKQISGQAVNGKDDHWCVNCPFCGKELEYKGFFDSTAINHCDCGCEFNVTKIWIDDETYIY